jgi:hypothetical protein
MVPDAARETAVFQRIFCGISAFAIAAACSASPGTKSTISGLDSTGGVAGYGAGAGGAAGAGGGIPRFVTSPDDDNNAGGMPIISTPLPEIDASSVTNCRAITQKGTQVTVDIFIMFDQSKSMSCAIATPPTTGTAGAAGAAGAPATGGATGAGGATGTTTDRWTAVKNALISFLNAPAAAGINVGIQYFGLGGQTSPFGTLSSCLATDYQMADVEIAALPGNAQPIIASLNAHTPTTNTPTAPALTGAINHAIEWKNKHADHAVVVVLVTDGQPNGCGTIGDVTNIAKMGVTATIPTYVIGVTSPGTTCDIDANPPNQQDLDTVAMAGGTTAAMLVDLSKDVVQQFLMTMDMIRARSVPPCQYTIPPPPVGEHLDPTKINVLYTPPMATMPFTLTSVAGSTACDAAQGGWYYDDPVTPKTVSLCPASCAIVKNDVSGSIDIALGCKTKTTQ